MSTHIARPKKQINKVSVWTAVFNFLMSLWVFFLPFIGIRNVNNMETVAGWYLMYQTSLLAFFVGIICFLRIPIALLRRKVRTPEIIQADIRKNKRSKIVCGIFLLWAIYSTAIVAMAVEIR
jgi:hypothetical protein